MVNLGMLPRVGFNHKGFDLTKIKILTPRKMFQELPITLALLKGLIKTYQMKPYLKTYQMKSYYVLCIKEKKLLRKYITK